MSTVMDIPPLAAPPQRRRRSPSPSPKENVYMIESERHFDEGRSPAQVRSDIDTLDHNRVEFLDLVREEYAGRWILFTTRSGFSAYDSREAAEKASSGNAPYSIELWDRKSKHA